METNNIDESVIIKGILVYYISIGMMPIVKAKQHIAEQRQLLKPLSDQLEKQGVQTLYIGITEQSTVEYINMQSPTNSAVIVNLIKQLTRDYISLNSTYTNLLSKLDQT
jgi:hypothetical protein